jgi:hypothetical protein
MARFDGKVALIGFRTFGDGATIFQLLQAHSPAKVVTGLSERGVGIARSRLSGLEGVASGHAAEWLRWPTIQRRKAALRWVA